MTCKKCGAQLPDDTKFCPECGETVSAQPAEANIQPPANAGVQYAAVPTPAEDRYQGFSMKWHKFLVYFALWAGALVNLFSGFSMLTGAQYGDASDYVYAVFPKLKTADLIGGVLTLLAALLAIVTAINLIKLKRGAPMLLTATYVAALLSGIVYIVLAISAMNGLASIGDLLQPNVISNMVMSVIMIFVNYIYYKKREPLFVN